MTGLRRFASRIPLRLRALALPTLAIASAPAFLVATGAAQTGTVDFTANRQQVEGFGFSQAFGASNSVGYLSPALQTQVWDLMFNPTTGAGLNVFRLGINTDSQIEPTSPGSPSATPTYVFDGSDGKQVQTAQIAQHYGVNNFFAVSWTAPAFMKTNGSENNAGSLCGVVNTSCISGDWRQAYANLLVQYVNFYQGVGVHISALGVQNEPDFTASYQSMTLTNNQIVDFIQNAFGPTVRAKLPGVRTMCCDSINWSAEQVYTGAFPYYPLANSYIDISTAHEYGYQANFAQNTTKPSWMTEWATLSATDELRWDAGGTADVDGMYLANDIIQAFNAGNVNEYTYWWGAVNQPNALVRVYIGNFAGYIQIPGRYYAMAALSRYVHPGAYRVATANSNTNLNVVAFRNTDGSRVLEVLNRGTAATSAGFTVDADTAKSLATTFLTDQTHSLAETDTAVIAGSQLSLALPARSLTTVVLPPTVVAGSIELVTTSTVQKLADGSYEASIKIVNNGTGTAQNVSMSAASLGNAQGMANPVTSLPQNVGTISPGGYATMAVNFPSTAGSSGAATIQRYTGTYLNGTFGTSLRFTLP